MKTKQLIERELKFNQKYIYLDIIRGSIESGQITTCENCGKLITNMVKVANDKTKQVYYIGTDCAETLIEAQCMYNNGQATDYQMDIYRYNKTARFVTELRKGKKYDATGFYLTVITDKDKKIECYTYDLTKYFPQYVQA